MKRNSLLAMTFYIICICLYLVVAVICYKLMINTKAYYLFVLIPVMVLFFILFLSTISKLFLILTSMIFGRNDNDEVNDKTDILIFNVNKITKYALFGLFLSFLSSIMVLDVILCIKKEQYVLVAISIVVWVLLHTLLFKNIIDLIRSEKNHS